MWVKVTAPRTPGFSGSRGPGAQLQSYCVEVTAYFSMIASTSRAERTRYSSLLYFTSVPPYLL